MRFLGHIPPEVSVRRLVFYTHKLRKLAGWVGKDFDTTDEDNLRSLLTLLSKGFARQDGGRYSLGTVHGLQSDAQVILPLAGRRRSGVSQESQMDQDQRRYYAYPRAGTNPHLRGSSRNDTAPPQRAGQGDCLVPV